jgi:hypothetical protein
MLVSGTADLDQAEQLILSQAFQPGYNAQPPLYTYLAGLVFSLAGHGLGPLAEHQASFVERVRGRHDRARRRVRVHPAATPHRRRRSRLRAPVHLGVATGPDPFGIGHGACRVHLAPGRQDPGAAQSWAITWPWARWWVWVCSANTITRSSCSPSWRPWQASRATAPCSATGAFWRRSCVMAIGRGTPCTLARRQSRPCRRRHRATPWRPGRHVLSSLGVAAVGGAGVPDPAVAVFVHPGLRLPA